MGSLNGEVMRGGRRTGLREEVGHEFVVVGDGLAGKLDGRLALGEADELAGDHAALERGKADTCISGQEVCTGEGGAETNFG